MKFWVVIDEKKRIFAWTLRTTRAEAQAVMVKHGAPGWTHWSSYRDSGYKCVKCALALDVAKK